MIRKIIGSLASSRVEDRRAELARNLVRHEAKIGGQLFGEIPSGNRREFFCLDESTWVWHEEWNNKYGERMIKTTRYNVKPEGIFKALDNFSYRVVSDDEALHLFEAAKAYKERVSQELYSFVA